MSVKIYRVSLRRGAGWMIVGEYFDINEAYRHLNQLQAQGERAVIERV